MTEIKPATTGTENPSEAETATGAALLAADAVPHHRGRLLAIGAAIGLAFTVIWSAPFVDDVIGDSVAGALLSGDAEAPAPGIVAGLLFALVSGLAGSFTACNIAALGAVGPMLGAGSRRRDRLRRALTPLSRLVGGMLLVSVLYGALVGVVGTRLPQFSTVKVTPGSVPPVLVQSMVVFGVIGAAMLYLALAALGLVPDPFARISRRYPNAPMVFMGSLIGGFLIGRPYPLFRAMFRDAAESHNPLFGAFAFSLQSIGNIVVLTILFLLLTLTLSAGAGRALATRPQLLAAMTGVGLTAAGVFTVLYWDVRLLAVLKVIPWYPLAPWV
jgi:hypothetical protein